jgi:citrate lyase subunit beta/citryl-CoA lyase
MPVRPRRSCLTVPGASARMLAKAPSLGADEVIVDLEDAVAEADKELARAQGAEAVRARLAPTTALRVNGPRTPWWDEDVDAAAAARPDVVVLPKAESPDDVAALAERLPPGIGIEAQVETARGLAEVERIAAAGHGLEALVFGPADFAASVGVPVLTIGAGTFDYALARIAVAARANGLQPIDGPWAVLDDEPGLVASARRALGHGFGGKWVIHPSQIAPVNAVFTPSDEEVARAERLLASATGAARLDGELVDEASRRLAEALLARARA